jgi:aspartate/methionine/tyrosine aminotransferase
VADVARVSITNVVCQAGIAMDAVATAIDDPNDGVAESARELQARRDLILGELAEFSPIPPHGGWSLLVDVSPLGMDGPTASSLLLEKGRIAATPMVNWGGEHCANYVRLVFSNETADRLTGIGDRFRSALC